MSDAGLADSPVLLRIPREFLEDVTTEDFDDEDLPRYVSRLPKFARTFFQVFFDEELGIEITGMGDEERGLAARLTVDYEEDEDRMSVVPLLSVFIDLCELYMDSEELSTPEQASEHQDEILALTTWLLEEISAWAKGGDLPVLGGMAGDLAGQMKALT